MARVKGAMMTRKRRNKILKMAKGYWGAKSKPGQHSYESEREILYKILYELRGNVADLRRDMNNLRKELDTDRKLRGAAGFEGAYIGGSTQLPAIEANHPISTYEQATPHM